MGHDIRCATTSLARTSGFSPQERQIVIGLVRETVTRGKEFHELPAAELACVEGKDFQWPEFDRWQAFFGKLGKFPPLWDHLQITPGLGTSAEARAAYQEQKFYLLLDWLHGLEITRLALIRYASRGLRAAVTRQDAGAVCPVCDLFNHGEVKAGAEAPPFHPGCRCVIVATTDRRRCAA
jgi:hypothetical protein